MPGPHFAMLFTPRYRLKSPQVENSFQIEVLGKNGPHRNGHYFIYVFLFDFERQPIPKFLAKITKLRVFLLGLYKDH